MLCGRGSCCCCCCCAAFTVMLSVGLAFAALAVMERGDSAAGLERPLQHIHGHRGGGIEIGLDRAVEQHSVLGDYGDRLAKSFARYMGNINPVVQNLPGYNMSKAEQR